MHKLILTDIDEVVLKFHEAIEKWVRSNQHILDGLKIKMPEYDKHLDVKSDMETWLGATQDKIIIILELFAKTADFGDINPGWESDHYIPKLHDLGYKFVAITSCGNNPVTKSLRIQNLEKYFPGVFSAVHTVGLTESKKYSLEIYRPSYWVEDKMSNAIIGKNCGHKPWLMTNEDVSLPCGMKKATSWETIYNCLTDDNCEILGWMC